MSSTVTPGYPAQTQGPPTVLPPEKVFPIQIGSELFRLSGASIASDAPSYFSHFFEAQLHQNGENSTVRTLYIDRDPDTFRDILRHLQGYYIRPRGNSHFVKLFADAQFYSLPRLISQLFECEIFIQIGDRHFEIPRDIFSGPGDSPNFFSLGFAVFFATPGEVFPGLDRQGLLRPPAITPPIVSNRSGEVFAELLHMLRGYPIHIRNEEHRAELLRDCRYFHLRGLEQKLLPHHISYNVERQRSEIVIRLEDIRPSGIQVAIDSSAPIQPATPGWWVQYARPFVDDDHYELIVEIGGESTQVDLESQRANFHGSTKSRMSSLLQVITNKTNLSTRGSQGLLAKNENISRSTTPGSGSLNSSSVRVQLDPEADIVLDGDRYESRWNEIASAVALDASAEESSWILNSTRDIAHEGFQSPGGIVAAGANSAFLNPPQSAGNLAGPSRKRKRSDSVERLREWIVRKGHWRLQVQRSSDVALGGLEVVLVALKLDAFTRQHSRNMQRGFLDAQ